MTLSLTRWQGCISTEMPLHASQCWSIDWDATEKWTKRTLSPSHDCQRFYFSEQVAGQDGFGDRARQVQQALGHHPRPGKSSGTSSNDTVGVQLGEYTIGELKKTIAGKKPKYRDINRWDFHFRRKCTLYKCTPWTFQTRAASWTSREATKGWGHPGWPWHQNWSTSIFQGINHMVAFIFADL